jgi:hypothetical protein
LAKVSHNRERSGGRRRLRNVLLCLPISCGHRDLGSSPGVHGTNARDLLRHAAIMAPACGRAERDGSARPMDA